MENSEEIAIGSSTASFLKFLDSQKEVFHGQIDQLQQIVVTQCNLTGVNPLSQEMAAGAMSVKIGKKPRDLLNPKAIKYMQAVFSMKDAISKKECREISAQFGITVTQVRDFFATQRTRVRKLVRLSREKATRANQHEEQQDGVTTNSDPMMLIDLPPLNSLHPDPVPLNSVGFNPASLTSASSNPDLLSSVTSNVAPTNAVNSTSAPFISIGSIPAPLNSTSYNPAPLNSIGFNAAPLNSIVYDPSSTSAGTNSSPLDSMPPDSATNLAPLEEAPSCSTQDGMLPGLDHQNKSFVENIFSLLRKEETFYGQEKLMEWILQIQNPSVLTWFLSKGGVMILATWLSQAAAEEQTSLLIVTLKVLCHLPLQKAVPEHMSAILHSVNRLRFYRTSDISNRARILLSRWSKLFARVQALKKPNGVKSSTDAQEMILKQSIDEIMSDDLWQPNENVLALCESSENNRKMDSSKILKLLPASSDDSSKKNLLGVSSSHARKRRKVQLVEQPGQKIGGRSPQSTKSSSASQARPMSADDIQKAKMRALYMQGKFEKTEKIGSSNGINGTKTGLNKPSSASSSSLSLVSKVPLPSKIEENKKPVIPPPKILNKQETPLDTKLKLDLKEPLGEVLKRVQIPWHAPPEMKLDDLWRVGTGENSKEVDIQRNRNRREIQTIYRTVKEIPSNPKEPWDLEMDYDDTLTPDIPIEQPPDPEVAEPQVAHDESIVKPAVTSTPALPNHGSASEPDLELLAVLLKNPELVFALTSGNSGTLSPEDTVKLLDMIKKGGTGLVDNTNEHSGKVEEKVEVSLPSPTPSGNPGTAGWRPEAVRNPFSQQNSRGKRVVYTDSTPGPTTIPTVQPQNQERDIRVLQQQAAGASIPQLLSQQVQAALPPYTLMQTTSSSSSYENQQPSMIFPPHQHILANSSMLETQSPDMGLPAKNLPMMNTHSVRNFHSTGPSMQVESANYVKPAQSLQYAMNTPERRQVLQFMPPSMPIATRSHPQAHLMPESRSSSGNIGSIPESWRIGRQGLGSNSVSLVNQTNYEFKGPLLQPHVRSAPRDRNGYANNDGFESWSPDNSPTRSPGYMPGSYYPGAGTNPGLNYNPYNRARQQNYDSGNRDQTRNANRRWH